jgi:hypothetical protein
MAALDGDDELGLCIPYFIISFARSDLLGSF